MSVPIKVSVKNEILDAIRLKGLRVVDVSAQYGVGVSTIYGWLRASRSKAATYLCAVANVISERSYGHRGLQTKKGTKLFAPHAKVYVVNYFWGKGAKCNGYRPSPSTS